MKKELLEQLKEDDYQEAVDTWCKEAYINSITKGSFQGWDYYLVYDEDGFDLVGPMGNGSMTMGMYKGTQLTLARIPAWREIETVVTQDVFNDLYDKKEFVDYILEQEMTEWDREEIENYHYHINYDGYYMDFNRRNFDNLIDEYAEAEWEAYGHDDVMEQISRRIDEYIEMEECM